MSAPSQIQLISPARVSQDTFIVSSSFHAVGSIFKVLLTWKKGVAWGSVGVTLLFIVFRFIVRFKVFGRLQPDDGLVLFSWISLLINASLWQIGQDALYMIVAVSSGQLYPPPTDFGSRTEGFLRTIVAVFVFFYTGLWSIKLAFLLFFKRLSQNVRHQDKFWWVVLSLTAATYVVGVGTIDYPCLTSPFSYMEGGYSLSMMNVS